ncbi:hypothetical protein B0H12DRAFT_313907 [Mycena haematopus]|nr:hypothetical protein B0H12DRAFT_313907 [Mycena haematopus]
MSIALTFADKNLLDTTVVAPDGTVQYTTTTTNGLLGRKTTIIVAASGVAGSIDWRQKFFVIDGVQKTWNHLKSRAGVFSSSRDWNWGNRPFKLEYQHSHSELLVRTISSSVCVSGTPTGSYYKATSLIDGNVADTVRFTEYRRRLFHDSERAMIYFPHHMEEIERMFLLMAILQTEIRRQDVARSNSRRRTQGLISNRS